MQDDRANSTRQAGQAGRPAASEPRLTGAWPGRRTGDSGRYLDGADLARCVIRGCPVRFRFGPDRKCADHSDAAQNAAAAALDNGRSVFAEVAAAAPNPGKDRPL
jgi:hypothetical protein